MGCKEAQQLAIIVVNYASHGLLARNLAAVAGENPHALIVVVDSFSSAAEQHAVAGLAGSHGWTFVQTSRNVGFGAGMNAGVAAAMEAGATTFLLLNPDAVLSAESVAALSQALAGEPMALLSPLIFDAGGRPWFAGADVRLDNGRTQSAARTRLEGAKGAAPTWPWLSGACLMLGEPLWRMAGGFDERYFLYWEDVDFSRRVVNAGGRLRIVEGASAVHDEGGTQGPAAGGHRAKSSQYYYYNTRNRLLFASLHLSDSAGRQWARSAVPAAWEILLRGGRRQFLHSMAPMRAALAGTRDGLRLGQSIRRESAARRGAEPPG